MGRGVDWKALGYGVAAFVVGYVLLTMWSSVMMTAGGGRSGWVVVQIMGYLMPVVAGFVAARKASRWRIAHGIAGGAIGVVPMTLLPMLLTPEASPKGIFIILVSYAVLAALGAIFGNHVGRKAAS